jgi:hypothetical protein
VTNRKLCNREQKCCTCVPNPCIWKTSLEISFVIMKVYHILATTLHRLSLSKASMVCVCVYVCVRAEDEMLRLSQAGASIPSLPPPPNNPNTTPPHSMLHRSPDKRKTSGVAGRPRSHLIHLTVCVHSRREKRHCRGGGRCENCCRE